MKRSKAASRVAPLASGRTPRVAPLASGNYPVWYRLYQPIDLSSRFSIYHAPSVKQDRYGKRTLVVVHEYNEKMIHLLYQEQIQKRNHWWSVVEDGNQLKIVNGYHRGRALAHCLTAVPVRGDCEVEYPGIDYWDFELKTKD